MDKVLVESTIASLVGRRNQLQREVSDVQDAIAETTRQIEAWQTHLRSIDGTKATRRKNGTKAPKGANEAKIKETLGLNGPMSADDLVQETGIGSSSVRSVLTREGSPFAKDGGLWKLKNPDAE